MSLYVNYYTGHSEMETTQQRENRMVVSRETSRAQKSGDTARGRAEESKIAKLEEDYTEYDRSYVEMFKALKQRYEYSEGLRRFGWSRAAAAPASVAAAAAAAANLAWR